MWWIPRNSYALRQASEAIAPTLRPGKSRWRGLGQLTPWLLLVAGLLMVRLSKGAGFTDAYALLSRPFWPGSAQREWVMAAADLEELSRLQLLEDDNRRLRALLELQQQGCLLYTSPSPRDRSLSRMPSSA